MIKRKRDTTATRNQVILQNISFQVPDANDVIAPYAAFPLLLHNATRGYGVAWYVAMLRAGKMQGPYGATGAYKISGMKL